MVQYISYTCNLRTGEPEVKAVVTSKYQTRPTNLLTYVQANIVVVIVLLTARKSLQFKQIRTFVVITIPILLFMSFNSVIIRIFTTSEHSGSYVCINLWCICYRIIVLLTARKSLQFKQIRNGWYWRKWFWCNRAIGSY
jgi:hypothetical protein